MYAREMQVDHPLPAIMVQILTAHSPDPAFS